MEKAAGTVISLFGSSSIQLVLIDSRCLERECFVRSVKSLQPAISVLSFSTVDDWTGKMEQVGDPVAVLYSTLGRQIAEKPVADEIIALERASRPIPVIVLSPFEDLSEMIQALDCGARGYIPACLGIEAMLTAVRLSVEGALFMTPASVLAMRSTLGSQKEPGAAETGDLAGVVDGQFTSRQAAVADHLRRGKPNKLIAYELNMCESTVKVHIRNIMKKLRVTNRTEASYKLNLVASQAELDLALGGVGQRVTSPVNERTEEQADPPAQARTS